MSASLITIVFAARVLSKDELGAFFAVMLVAQIAGVVGDCGVRNASIKVLSSLELNSTEFIEIARYISGIALVSSVITTLAVFALSPKIVGMWASGALRENAWFMAPMSLAMVWFQTATSLLVSARHFRPFAVIGIVVEIGRAAFSIGGMLLGGGVSALLWGMLLSRLVAVGSVWYLMPRHCKPLLRRKPGENPLRGGGWLYGGSLMSLAIVKTTDAIVTTLLGTSGLAIYSTAMQIPNLLQRMFESIRPVLLGAVSAEGDTDVESVVNRIRLFGGMIAVGTAILIALSGPLFQVLYPNYYDSGLAVMRTLCVWVAVGLLNYFMSITLIGVGHPERAFVLLIPQAIIIVVTSVSLIPAYGALGAALALVITSTVGNMFGIHLVSVAIQGPHRAMLFSLLRVTVPLLFLLAVSVAGLQSEPLVVISACVTIVVLERLKAIKIDDIGLLLKEALNK